MRGDGTIFKRKDTATFWLAYWVRGKQYREAGGRTEAEAKRKLKARLKEIHGDRFVGPQEERLMVDELLDNLLLHLKTKGAKSVVQYESTVKPVREHFALTPAINLTTPAVEKFIHERLAAEKAPATVNRETGALKQALNLARK